MKMFLVMSTMYFILITVYGFALVTSAYHKLVMWIKGQLT